MGIAGLIVEDQGLQAEGRIEKAGFPMFYVMENHG